MPIEAIRPNNAIEQPPHIWKISASQVAKLIPTLENPVPPFPEPNPKTNIFSESVVENGQQEVFLPTVLKKSEPNGDENSDIYLKVILFAALAWGGYKAISKRVHNLDNYVTKEAIRIGHDTDNIYYLDSNAKVAMQEMIDSKAFQKFKKDLQQTSKIPAKFVVQQPKAEPANFSELYSLTDGYPWEVQDSIKGLVSLFTKSSDDHGMLYKQGAFQPEYEREVTSTIMDFVRGEISIEGVLKAANSLNPKN